MIASLPLALLLLAGPGPPASARAGVDYTIEPVLETLARVTVTFDSSVASATTAWSTISTNLAIIDTITVYNIPGLANGTLVLPTSLATPIGSTTGMTLTAGHVFVALTGNPTTARLDLDFANRQLYVYPVSGFPVEVVGGTWLQASGFVPGPAPAPASLVLMTLGLAGVGGMAWRRRGRNVLS